jgi:hypothetical protein
MPDAAAFSHALETLSGASSQAVLLHASDVQMKYCSKGPAQVVFPSVSATQPGTFGRALPWSSSRIAPAPFAA